MCANLSKQQQNQPSSSSSFTPKQSFCHILNHYFFSEQKPADDKSKQWQFKFFQAERELDHGKFGVCFKVRLLQDVELQLGNQFVVKSFHFSEHDNDHKKKKKHIANFQNEVEMLEFLMEAMKDKTQFNEFVKYYDSWKELKGGEKTGKEIQKKKINEKNTNNNEGQQEEGKSEEVKSILKQEAQELIKNAKRGLIVIEFCSNGSIREYLKKIKRNGKRLSSNQIMYLVIKIVEALEVLHKQYVIHRDIKLENILLDKDFNIRICDFGLSVKGHNKSVEKFNYAGTPIYMAPEILQLYDRNQSFRKEHPYSLPVDVWALGVMIYYLLTDRYYGEVDPLKSAEFIKKGEGEIPSLSLLKELLRGMLVEDQKKRKTIEEVNNIIKNHVAYSLFMEEKKKDEMQMLIRQQLREKKYVNKVQVKRVFAVGRVGYCVLLDNVRSFLIYKQMGCLKIIEARDKVIRNLLQKKSTFLKTLSIEQYIQVLAHARLLTVQYFSFLMNWRSDVSIDEYVGDDTSVVNAYIVREDVLALKLSNGVIQFFFGQKSSQTDQIVYSISFSLNYSMFDSGNVALKNFTTGDEQTFNSWRAALGDKTAAQYVRYVREVLWTLAVPDQHRWSSKGYKLAEGKNEELGLNKGVI